MVRVTFSALTPSTIPTEGWIVRYRIKGTSGGYTTVGPFMSLPFHFDTTDPVGTLYEGFVKRDCGVLESTELAFTTPCDCTQSGYVPDAGDNNCTKQVTVSPTVTNPGFCLAPSTYSQYTQFESRIYLPGFVSADVNLAPGSSGGNIYGSMTTAGQWANPTSNPTLGPMNREGVWIDSDCDGSKDALAGGVNTTIAYQYNNITGSNKTVYVGLSGDNFFKLIVNGAIIVDTSLIFTSNPFKIFHIFPVVIPPGISYFNFIGQGDGSTSDSIAVVVYDNTASEIHAAISDAALNILFKSSSLRGTTYDVSTCPGGYSLDTSAGSGSYICRKTLIMACNTAP